jgi:hypothetical protein
MSVHADDLEAIASVLNGYAEAVDRRRWHLFDAIFASDVETTFAGGTFTGLPATVAYLRSKLGGCGPTQHLLGNFQIRIDGKTAHSECKVRAWHAGAGELAGKTFELLGCYHDELRETEGGWRITKRRLETVASFGSPEVLRP